jgi:hypothetical protein
MNKFIINKVLKWNNFIIDYLESKIYPRRIEIYFKKIKIKLFIYLGSK